MFRITYFLRALCCAGTLFGICAVAWAGHQPDHEGERLTPEQVGGEKRMSAMLAEARTLAQRGVFDAAVRNYLHVFNFGRGIARLEIVRLALIPAEIAALGESFPPALMALREEVRIRAGLILNNVAGTDEMLEFISLNRALDQPRRSLELYDQLKSMGERARDTRLLMRAVLSQELLDARRFDELGEHIIVMAREVMLRMATLEAESVSSVGHDPLFNERHAAVLNGAPQIYDALLNTQRDEIANAVADRMLRLDHSISSYTALVNAALRAQRKPVAQALVQRAAKELQPAELTRLKGLLTN